MNYCERYIKRYGETTEEQKKILKASIGYQRCELADVFDELKKEMWDSIKNMFKKKR